MSYSPAATEPARTSLIEPPEAATAASVSAGARLKRAPRSRIATAPGTVAVLGLGYVGLPTGLALASRGFDVLGVDVSERRLQDIRAGSADLLRRDRARLSRLVDTPSLQLTADARALGMADAVLVCVPTPVDERLEPDLRALEAACATVVAHARSGQLIVLTSTSYVGTTRELLVGPLARRGLRAGEDVFVAFSPERIDPGNTRNRQEVVPRVVGGVTEACGQRAEALMGRIASKVHRVSTPEAAELTKLYENSFRAVNIGFANEMAGVCRRFGLDPMEVTEAAATKPYGFMPFYPGAGVGGHCIPCDPHYLLGGLRKMHAKAPLLEQAMRGIAGRPRAVVRRALELLAAEGISARRARLLVVGAAYKPGIRDVRESPAVEIMQSLSRLGAQVAYHDPLVRSLDAGSKLTLLSVSRPDPADFEMAIVVTVHPRHDYDWLASFRHVLDCTYRVPAGQRRSMV
jgi:UDP-N-acetyl-D-glucosamine dehydrogenase